MSGYRPGVCNIGPRGRLWRLGMGAFFLALGGWGWLVITVNHFPRGTAIALFIPFYLGFLALYEAVFGFCILQQRRRTFDMR